jgi:hypothetical protein
MSPIETKIAKLLKLAGNNPNEAEATAAAEKAQRLMLKHGIEMGQIAMEEGGSIKIQVDSETHESKLDPWRINLASSVARSAGGQMVFTRAYGKWSGSIEFFGPAGTTSGMVKVYTYLEQQLDRLSLIAATKELFANSAKSMSWRRSYLWGASARVCIRLEARLGESNGNSQALVVVKDSVSQAIEEKYSDLTSEKKKVTYDAVAASKGFQEAGEIALGDDELKERTVRELS